MFQSMNALMVPITNTPLDYIYLYLQYKDSLHRMVLPLFDGKWRFTSFNPSHPSFEAVEPTRSRRWFASNVFKTQGLSHNLS